MIYCVEDNADIRELVVYTLTNTGFEAVGFERGADFLTSLEKRTPELILLDIMLPDIDGIELLKRVRINPKTKGIPLILLTAKGTEYDKVIGLDSGADDYITKPFGMMELLSRIKALLRRAGKPDNETELEYRDLKIDTRSHGVFVAGKQVSLTLKEFELLRVLIRNAGRVLTRDMLLESVWGYDGQTRTVDVHIRSLRSKLEYGSDIIQTVRGVGYRLGGVE